MSFTQEDFFLTGIPLYRLQEIENLWIIPTKEEINKISSALKKSKEFLFPKELMELLKLNIFRAEKKLLKLEEKNYPIP